MAQSGYRSIYCRLFDDRDFQRLSPAARLILLTLRQCEQAGPAAIYRYYPELLARQTGYRIRQVMAGLQELQRETWVVYDETVAWVRNGLRYDPTGLRSPSICAAVTRRLETLPRSHVIVAFCRYYHLPIPQHCQNMEILTGCPEGLDTPSTPSGHPTPDRDRERERERDRERESAEGESEGNSATGLSPGSPGTHNGHESHGGHEPDSDGHTPAALHTPWVLAPAIVEALRPTRFAALVGDRAFWQAEFRVHSSRGISIATEVRRADAWCTANPSRAPRKDVRRFLHSWFGRAEDST